MSQLNLSPLPPRALLEQLAFLFDTGSHTTGFPTPICIWGPSGIGKSSLVRQFAAARQLPIQLLSPAQFSEMGDLLGLPAVEEGQTRFLPPHWVPAQPGPGILVLDDFNRAETHILQGLMPLLEHGRLLSWALPPGWQIILTTNPPGHDYLVRPLDPAMMTRLQHLALDFNPLDWAKWARSQSYPERAIDFVLAVPDIMQAPRTNPRSMAQLFELLKTRTDWANQHQWLSQIGSSCVDQDTVLQLIAFLRQPNPNLPDTADFLAGKTALETIQAALSPLIQPEQVRLDALSRFFRKLALALRSETASPELTARVRSLLLWEQLPDILLQDLVGHWQADQHLAPYTTSPAIMARLF